jgi:hypothetical protein
MRIRTIEKNERQIKEYAMLFHEARESAQKNLEQPGKREQEVTMSSN